MCFGTPLAVWPKNPNENVMGPTDGIPYSIIAYFGLNQAMKKEDTGSPCFQYSPRLHYWNSVASFMLVLGHVM